MFRLVMFLLAIALIASGLGWLADRPGTVAIDWQGYVIETTVFRATVIASLALATGIMAWSVLKTIWNSPAFIGERILARRKKRGLDALSSGMIAIGAGDKALATRYALQARKTLPHEPMTHLLRAQAAQLSGDRSTARRIYEAMLTAPETEQLGLRGLYLEAEREGEGEAARQYAYRALKSNPKLGWSADALFDLQCKSKDWAEALDTLAQAKKNGNLDRVTGDRKRAVLLTQLAIENEDNDSEKALAQASEAHALAPDLIPAAVVAGRILASRGQTGKAAKIIHKTWAKAPHPDLAAAYAFARVGDSTRDRLDRMRQLMKLNPDSIEGPLAFANAAIDARFFGDARDALAPLADKQLTKRVAMLMAKLEGVDGGDKGRVREWLSRSVTAEDDPVWMADGVISDKWEPISPVDGRLDVFVWRVPTDARDKARAEIVLSKVGELLAIDRVDSDSDADGKTEEPQPRHDDDDAVTLQPVTTPVRARAFIEPVRDASVTVIRGQTIDDDTTGGDTDDAGRPAVLLKRTSQSDDETAAEGEQVRERMRQSEATQAAEDVIDDDAEPPIRRSNRVLN
jgi:HemY protein